MAGQHPIEIGPPLIKAVWRLLERIASCSY